MKIPTKKMDYDKVMALPRPKHRKPLKPLFLLQSVIRVGSIPSLWKTRFTYEKHRMELLDPKEPMLILMNHSSFTDMKVASAIFYPKKYSIVASVDSFVGMEWLMRLIGCIPTRKFLNDMTLIKDMEYMLKEKKTSVLMYPEAGYSFDGTTTQLPRKLGVLMKKLGVPVVTVITQGAFARDPLYNGLQLRKVKVRADVTCLFTAQEIKEKTVAELDAGLDEAFGFDQFRYQQENNIVIDAPFRADGLNRILFRCPHCDTEGKTEGKGIYWTCHNCGKQYELTETGFMKATDGDTRFDHIPDWYRWQRQQIRQELESGSYRLERDVEIGVLVDYKAVYMVGDGKLVHTPEGFHLTGCDGKLDYTQSPLSGHSINADYLWYEIGDTDCLGNQDVLYFCFPKGGDCVARIRMAVEELYKMKKKRRVKE